MNPAIQAIHNRDPDALDQAFSSLDEAAAFRNNVLPSLSPADCKWFWQQVMEPDQLAHTLDLVRDVCLAVAREMALIPGKDYSLGSVDGLSTMILTVGGCQRFYDRIPRERHSILRFYLQCLAD